MQLRPKSEEKVLFQRKICYLTVQVEIRRQEQKLGGISPWQRGSQNHFRLQGQGGRIILVNTTGGVRHERE
jgi:hypothetical protein